MYSHALSPIHATLFCRVVASQNTDQRVAVTELLPINVLQHAEPHDDLVIITAITVTTTTTTRDRDTRLASPRHVYASVSGSVSLTA